MDYLSRIDRSLGLEPEEKEEEKKYIEADSYLDRIDRSLAPQAQQEEESGFGSDLLHALFQGADQTTAMLGGTLMLAGGPDSSENIAAHYKNRNNPAYVEAYDQLLARNTAERAEHWDQGNYWKWLGSLGEWAYNATNDDKSLTYKIVEMLPNSVPTFGGGAIGGFAAAGAVAAGVVSAPVTAIVGGGFIVGMGLGTILTIVGEKALDNVEEFGGSLEDAGSIREVFNNPEFQDKAAKEGLIKGVEIALVDALSFKLAGRLFTAPGKKLERAIHDELTELGVNTAEQAAVRKAYSNPKLREKLQDHIDDYLKSTYEATDETVASIRRAADEFAKSQTFTNRVRRGAKAVGIESLGEGVGEFVGEYHATGEAKLSDAMFEAIAGLGQSAATVGAAKALSGVGTGAKKALEKISRAQVESVAQGENSGLDPADINAAQVDFNEVNTQTTNALNERLRSEGSATPNISAYEEVLGDNEIRENLDQIVEGLIEEGGYEQYNETLKGFAREVYGESVSIYIPIAPEDEALVQSAESIPPETSTVAQAANIPGEYVTVYTDDGKPIRTKVVKESKSGAKTVLDEQGSEVILDKSPLKSTPPEKQADLPDTQSRLSGYAVGSLDRSGVTARPGSNVVRITVPVDDIISRGNQAKGQLVVRVDNLKQAELTPKRPIEKEEATVLSAAQKRESQIAQGEQLEKHEQEFDAGHRGVEVEESKKTDPKKLRRAALRENERKIARLPEIEALREGKSTKTEDGKRVTTISLARVIKQNNVPTEKGRGEVSGTIDTRKRDVRDYLNALEKPDQLDAVNAVLKKRGAKLSRKNDELILTDNANNEFGLGTIRIQEYTVDEYLDFAEEQKTELAMDTQRATERKRERTQLSATVLREKKRKMPVGRVATNIRIIEDKFVTREKGITRIDEAGLDRYLENVTTAGEWKKSELSALDREVKRLRNEVEITERSRDASKPAPQHRVIAGTRPSPLAPGMGKVSRLTGRTLRKFHASASNILHKGTTDSLLGKIAGAYTKKKRVGAVGEEKVTPANILTLPSSADNDLVARVYSLASMLIYGQDSVTYSRPDSSLNLDSDSTSLGGYLKSNKVLNDSQFGKLNQEVQRLIGSGSTLIRISDFEYIIHNDSLGKSQLARRLGRLQAKFGNTYGFQTEFFVSKTETLTHNWAEDSLGTGIRNQIRELGFSDLLAFVDNRRDAFLELAQQYGANIEETKQQGIAFEQPPATGPPIPKRKIRASLKKGEYHRLKQTDYEALPDDIRAVVDQRLNQLEDPARARAALIANKNTPWAGQAIEGAITRVAMEMLIAGKTPTFPNIFDSTVKSGKPNPAIKRYLEAFKGGVEGVWLDLAQRHMIGHAAKPIHSVNSSFINCEPSLNCAKFCYATSGNYSYLPVILKGELSDWAVTNNPERAAELTAQEYSHTAEFYTNKALRIFDKGDGNSHYLKYIKALNDTVIDGKPIRVQVFSKHPEFLRQVPEMNVRLLSIDETNQQLALDNTDLGVSYVYTGSKSDIAFLEHNEERFTRHGGVILPVKLGRNTLDKKETAKLPKWVKKYTCPIDGGVKEIGIGKGKWNCTECDKGGGLGCYHGQTTKSILDIITEARREPYEKTLRETEDPLRELARQYAPDREADLVAELRSLIRLAQEGADTVADAEYDATAGAESGEGQGLDTLNTDPPDVKASIPLKKPADGGFFLGRARSELNKKWGKKNIDSLEAQGIIKIISNVTELPADIQELYETHEGIHDETTGISYLIAENIREGEASGVLMHEVGTHFGLKRMVGNKAFAGILNDLLNRRTSDELAPYFAEVKDAYASLLKSGEMVEYSEDFLEEVLAKIAQDPKASNMGIIEEIYRRIRVFLSKHFEGIELKPADLQALTRGALKKSMKGRFRAESLEGSRVMAAIGDTDPQFQELVMNIVRRPDMAYRDFPANPTRKVSNRHKDAEFSSPLVEGHVNKKAKNKLWDATQALEAIFKDLNSDHTMDIDFSLNERAFAKSERVVRIRERKSGTMLVYRFGFEPIDKIKGLMLGPVVDFHNMGVFTKNEEYTLLQMKADFKKGVKLLKQGKLKKQHTLSLWANFRMGPKPPANYFIRHLKEDQTWDQFILVEELTDKQTVARIVMAEDIAIQNGYLPDGPVTPVQNPHGRYRYSLPSQSTNDLDAADKAVIQKATGKTEPGHVIQAYENFRSNPRLWFGQGVADRYLSIKNTLGNDGERAWKMMQLSDSADGLLHAVLQYGRPKEMVFNGEFDGYALDENSKGLMTILEGLEGETDRFLTWMAGHRADQLSKPTAKHPEGREKFFTKDDIARMKKFGKGKTLSGKSRTLLFAQTMREIAKFQSDILDLAMKAGVISKTDRMSLLTDFYLPFYREFEKEGKTHIRGPAMNTDAVNLRDVIHGLQGSELKTNDLLHNLMMNWHSLLNASMKNRAGVAAVEAAVEAGVARLLDKKEAAQVSYGKSKSKTDKFKNMVYVMRDGEREWYEINDHFVLESLLQMNWQGPSGMFSTAMSHFKRMLTITVTASPAFKVRNLIRDTLHSVAVSDLNYNIFGNVKEGMTRASIHDPIYQRLIASGGAFHFGFLHDDPSSIRRILKYSNKGLPRNEAELKKQVLDTPGKALNFLRKGWDKYGEVGNRLENANRVALYLQRVDEIGHLEASFEARDLLNFAAGGSFPIVQYLTNGIAFLNARIVGTHKLIRSGTEKEKRAKFVKVVGTITLASILYELGMDDDEDYKNLPDYVKETYWAVRLPGDKERWFLIPKPFEVGAIASIGQRMTQMFIDESASPAFFADRVFNILRDQLAFDWRFQAFKPILEVGLNYDEFRDQQIESEGWRASGKLKHKRFRQNSSELAKAASAFLADYQPGDTALSPVQIDHLIRGYFGWLGMTIAGWGDIVLGDDAPEPTARFGDSKPGVMNLWGVAPVSSFYKEGPLKGNAQVNVFWEQYKDMQTLWQEYKGFVETNGADGELEEWLAENGKTIEWRRAYENMRKHMGNIGKATTAVYDDLEMTPNQKRKKIDEYIELRNKSAEGLVKMRQEYEQGQKSGSPISDARADASVEDDYDVAELQAALRRGMYGKKEPSVADKLYDAINAAEFRGLSRFGSNFIRTRHAPKGGSSAYGPLQITTGLMRIARNQLKLNKRETAYVERFIKQGELFLKYGNEPDREGYQDKYDYGGKGDLSGSADRKLYEQVGKKLLDLVWKQSNEDMKTFLNAWRFGGKKEVERKDRKYFAAFKASFYDY